MTTILKIVLLVSLVASVNSLYCQPYNCYELLEVSSSATPQEIKKAFRTMAKRHHPDKNKLEDTTQLFQKINAAYEILDNQYTRKSYDAFLRDPSGSRAYHTYKYYQASYSPQVNPFLVIFVLIVLLSWLQWVMRKQMYASAVESIVKSEDFKKKVNQQCIADGKKGDKRYKQEVAERLQSQISIQGGYSQPEIQDLLFCRIVLLPYSIVMGIKQSARWIWKYYIKRQKRINQKGYESIEGTVGKYSPPNENRVHVTQTMGEQEYARIQIINAAEATLRIKTDQSSQVQENNELFKKTTMIIFTILLHNIYQFMDPQTIKVKADFSGGLDLVFDGKTQIELQVKPGTTVAEVIKNLAQKHANSKKQMFYLNDKIRPGILVLVNQVDWELADKEQCVLERGDKVSFISTLHGG